MQPRTSLVKFARSLCTDPVRIIILVSGEFSFGPAVLITDPPGPSAARSGGARRRRRGRGPARPRRGERPPAERSC